MKKQILLISVISLLSIVFVQCDNNKPKDNTTTNNKELKQANYSFENPPKFRHDGDLTFIQNETFKELFKIQIEVASTDEEKARGLMFRPEMAENSGMLFLFLVEEIQSFYMRNTIISLDIIYVNAKKQIVDIYKETLVKNETSLPSKAPAMYVVEVNAGICDKYGIKEGDLISY